MTEYRDAVTSPKLELVVNVPGPVKEWIVYGDEVVISGIYSPERGGWIGTASVTLSANPAIPGPSSPLKKEFASDPQRSKQIGEFDVAQQVLDFMEKEYGVLWSRKSTKLIL